MLLTATTSTLELATSSASATDWCVSFADITASTSTGGSARGTVSSATTTTAVSAPAASTTRKVRELTVANRGTSAQTITIKQDESGSEFVRYTATLQPGWQWEYTETGGARVLDATGRPVETRAESSTVSGRSVGLLKVGTAPEAAGQWYSWAKDSGLPGAWGPGTPGLNGRATDGTAAPDLGCLPIPNPSAGNNYLTAGVFSSSVANSVWLFDVLWVNSGLVVTTTTAQALTSVAWPARDANGSSNGANVWVGILVTTATTNAGAVTNTTLSYTNQDGTAGRTATIASFPATAVIGTVVWFQLQAGDTGVRSIQSVTLGTSYAAGAISLIAAVPLLTSPLPIANVGVASPVDPKAGVRLYSGVCALPMAIASATTATTVAGTIYVSER